MRINALFLLLFFAGQLIAKPVLVNGTAAVVEKTLITIQDAYIYRALQRFKSGETPPVLLEEGEELKKTVQKLVFEEMVRVEMRTMNLEVDRRLEVQKWISLEKSKGRGSVLKEVLKRFELSEAQVVDRMAKSLQVEEFLQKKVETMTPIITQEEAQRYFKQNESRFRGNSFEALKPSIIVLLKKQSLQKSLEEWVRFLKEKYAVVSLLETP